MLWPRKYIRRFLLFFEYLTPDKHIGYSLILLALLYNVRICVFWRRSWFEAWVGLGHILTLDFLKAKLSAIHMSVLNVRYVLPRHMTHRILKKKRYTSRVWSSRCSGSHNFGKFRFGEIMLDCVSSDEVELYFYLKLSSSNLTKPELCDPQSTLDHKHRKYFIAVHSARNEFGMHLLSVHRPRLGKTPCSEPIFQ